jgi:GNAT superfamily N-acetyltransferase
MEFKVHELTGPLFDEHHNDAARFLEKQSNHEKRVRKASREWFAQPGTEHAAGTKMFVAVADGSDGVAEVIGVTACRDFGRGAGFTVVHPEYRKFGVGLALLKAKLAALPEYASRVAMDNEACLRLMFKSGMIATGMTESETNGKVVLLFVSSSTVPAAPPRSMPASGSLSEALRDGRPKIPRNKNPRWIVTTRVPVKQVTRSTEIIVTRNYPELGELPEGAVRVKHGKTFKVVTKEFVLNGGPFLYRDEARLAKRNFVNNHNEITAETWGDVVGAHDYA